MNEIRPLAETGDTVTLSRADYEALLAAAEDAMDLAAVRAQDAREAELGKEAARADHLAAAEVRRILDGEHPLRVWREKRGLSQRGLAATADVSPSYLAEIEGGQKPGSAEALRRLSTALGVAIEDLLPPSPSEGDGTPSFREGRMREG